MNMDTNVDVNMNISDDLFLPLDESEKDSEFIAIESRSFIADAARRFSRNKLAMAGFIVLSAVVLLAIFGPVFSHYTFDGQDPSSRNSGSSLAHWFGTDKFGRDIFVRLLYGARISLMVGFVSAGINMAVGIAYGGISGYLGGKADMLMMRVVDIIYAIPSLLYVILIMLALGSNIRSILIGICISSWVSMARIVRSEILKLKTLEFSTAAFVIGASKARILFRHLLINALGPIIVTLTFMIPQAIFTEAFLSFVGVGISAPFASWGTLVQDARAFIDIYPMQVVYPVLAICVTIFSLNFIGDGLSDALNPKSRR
jgi:oligopeptide transport system permease protein